MLLIPELLEENKKRISQMSFLFHSNAYEHMTYAYEEMISVSKDDKWGLLIRLEVKF